MITYVFDLDGTLCDTSGTDYMGAEPFMDRINRVNRLYEIGHTIIIDTARGSGSGEDWHERTAAQLHRWGVQHHQLRCGVKFPASIYVDDRAIDVLDWITDRVDTVADRLTKALNQFAPLDVRGDKKALAGVLGARMESADKQPGTSYPSVLGYFAGRTQPSLNWITEAALVMGVRREWLAFGGLTPVAEVESPEKGG